MMVLHQSMRDKFQQIRTKILHWARIHLFLIEQCTSNPFTCLHRVCSIVHREKIEQSTNNIRTDIFESDIACALILLKKRHRLSARCIDDILGLFQKLDVKNVPKSWYRLKKSFLASEEDPMELYICPSCEVYSTTSNICSECQHRQAFSSERKSFFSFSIAGQLKRIINSNKDILFSGRLDHLPGTMKDICDGKIYREMQNQITEKFITLTMNVDGIQPNRNSHQTIWPILLVVNELPVKQRYAIENVILAGVWPGKNKPKRTEMCQFFGPVVDELVLLESPGSVHFSDINDRAIEMCVFLIGGCCDKPAQALLQCLPEPIAAYGCGRCEVHGTYRKVFYMGYKQNIFPRIYG